MRASTTFLDDHQVKLTIEVEESEFEDILERTARDLSQQINIKGFRKGKAPRRVIEARLGGPSALRAEALKSYLGEFYARAISETLTEPISQPSLEILSGESEGPLTFEASVSIRPEAIVVGYETITATLPSPEVSEESVDAQVQRLLGTDAELRDIDRPTEMGDVVQVDVVVRDTLGEQVDQVEDFTLTLGGNALAQGVDEIIVGHVVGDQIEAVGRRGKAEYQRFDVTIKAIRERIVPDLTDEWVAENSEYATVEELKDGLREQMRRYRLANVRMAQRDAVLTSLSELVENSDLPETLVNAELEERLAELKQRLTERGMSYEYYLEVTEQSPEDLFDTLREDARRAVRIDLALRAIVRLEELDPSEEEIEAELKNTANSLRVEVDRLRKDLHERGRWPNFTAEVGKFKASQWLYEHVTYMDEDGAEIDREIFNPTSPTDATDDADEALPSATVESADA